jgi:hypothetical protein
MRLFKKIKIKAEDINDLLMLLLLVGAIVLMVVVL